jgi:hypothetical protein
MRTRCSRLTLDSHIVKTDVFRAAHVLYGGAKLIRVVILRDETTFYEFADVAEEDSGQNVAQNAQNPHQNGSLGV